MKKDRFIPLMIQLVINGKDSKYIIEFSLYNNLNKKRYELINK